MTSPPKPVTFTTEQVTKQKLNDLANNVQWLIDNNPRTRYYVPNIIRDTGVKILAGKTPFPKDTTKTWGHIQVNFGSFFTAGCKPVVTTSLETTHGNMHRGQVAIQGRNGEIDHTGFTAIVRMNHGHYKNIGSSGWVTWIAMGW